MLTAAGEVSPHGDGGLPTGWVSGGDPGLQPPGSGTRRTRPRTRWDAQLLRAHGRSRGGGAARGPQASFPERRAQGADTSPPALAPARAQGRSPSPRRHGHSLTKDGPKVGRGSAPAAPSLAEAEPRGTRPLRGSAGGADSGEHPQEGESAAPAEGSRLPCSLPCILGKDSPLAVSILDAFPSRNFSSSAPNFLPTVSNLSKFSICTNFLIDSFCTRRSVSPAG